MRRAAFSAFAIALALGVLAVRPSARAQTGTVPVQLAGVWVLDGTIAHAMRTVDAAFGPGIAALPELIQNFARTRMHSSMAPPGRITVRLAGPHVHVEIESTERHTIVDGELGAHASVTEAEGTPTVTPRLSGGWLELFWEGEGSQMMELLSTEADGAHMHFDYTVISPQLPTPVRYRLEYHH